jgi:putative transcriptional regulator
MPIRIHVGELAKQRGLTIKALAERAGVAYNTAHALYTARATRIDLDTLDRMCVVLGVEPGDLLIRHEEQVPTRPDRAGTQGMVRDQGAGAGDQRRAGRLKLRRQRSVLSRKGGAGGSFAADDHPGADSTSPA